MSFFDLFKRPPAEANATEIWKADPLVIADADGDIKFAGRVDVEVTHLESGKLGMRTVAEGQPSHSLDEAEEFLAPEATPVLSSGAYDRLQKGVRSGVSYFGKDAAGLDSYWYFNSVADAYVRTQDQAKLDNAEESIP